MFVNESKTVAISTFLSISSFAYSESHDQSHSMIHGFIE